MDEAGTWLPLAEAARRLGTSVDGLRARVRRREIGSKKDNKNRVLVLVAADEAAPERQLGEDDPELSALREELADARVENGRLLGELSGVREGYEETRQRLVAAEARADRLQAALDEARTPLLLRLVRAWRGR